MASYGFPVAHPADGCSEYGPSAIATLFRSQPRGLINQPTMLTKQVYLNHPGSMEPTEPETFPLTLSSEAVDILSRHHTDVTQLLICFPPEISNDPEKLKQAREIFTAIEAYGKRITEYWEAH